LAASIGFGIGRKLGRFAGLARRAECGEIGGGEVDFRSFLLFFS
jgi:hypothetical protein